MSIQTSDADLRALQAPEILIGTSGYLYSASGHVGVFLITNFGGARVNPSTIFNNIPSDFSSLDAGLLDLSGASSIQGGCDLSNQVTLNASLTISSDADVAKYPIPSLSTIVGGSAQLGNDGFTHVSGGNATLTATGLSADPNFPVSSLGGGGSNDTGAGGIASMTVQGSFATAVSQMNTMSAGYDYATFSNAGNVMLSYANCPNLTTLDLSALAYFQPSQTSSPTELDVSNCPNLTSVLMNASLGVSFNDQGYGGAGGLINFHGAALGAAALNVILASLVAGASSVGSLSMTIDISGGTNATPDSTGLAYIATLTGTYGWTVYNN